MSAEVLREAARAMRIDAPALDEDRAWHPAVAFAVANWLEEEADHWTDPDDDGLTYYRAYVVATTYLGGAS